MTKLTTQFLYWKLAIYKLVSGSLIIGISTFVAATAAMDWDNISGSSQFIIILSALAAMLKNADSFLSETMGRLKSGKDVSGFDSDPETFKK